MSGWLIQVPVRRFGTEPIVHLYAVWVPDNTDALAAVEKRVDTTNEMPELLVELSDGTLRGLAREETCVASTPSRKRVHPSEATPRAADKVFFARGFPTLGTPAQ